MDLRLIIHYDKSYIGIFSYIGITESKKVLEVQRRDLVAEYIGGTANKTAKIINETDGVSHLYTRDTPYASPTSTTLGRRR